MIDTQHNQKKALIPGIYKHTLIKFEQLPDHHNKAHIFYLIY